MNFFLVAVFPIDLFSSFFRRTLGTNGYIFLKTCCSPIFLNGLVLIALTFFAFKLICHLMSCSSPSCLPFLLQILLMDFFYIKFSVFRLPIFHISPVLPCPTYTHTFHITVSLSMLPFSVS